MTMDITRYLDASKKVDLTGIDFASAGKSPLQADEIRCAAGEHALPDGVEVRLIRLRHVGGEAHYPDTLLAEPARAGAAV